MRLAGALLAYCFLTLGLPVAAQDAAVGDPAASVVRGYVEKARQGQNVDDLVSKHASVAVVGVGSPYVHSEFVAYFRHCALASMSPSQPIAGFREIAGLGDLDYVVATFSCRDGDTVEPPAQIGFGVQSSMITRIDLNPELFLAQIEDAS